MLKSYNFPSVYEATNQELANVAENILDGIKINLDDTDYIVGNLALVEGYSPHKSINAAPTDEEYKLLSEASLLLTQPKGEEEIYLTTGFPFATYILYRDKAMEVLQGRHIINYDASTFGGPNTTKREVNVGKVEIIPEIMGCTTAIREGNRQEKENFFLQVPLADCCRTSARGTCKKKKTFLSSASDTAPAKPSFRQEPD